MALPMQKARYLAHAIAISFGTSANGNIQTAVTFEIEDEGFAGETIAWIGHFTDKTSARTIESLQHAGWRGDDLSELDELSYDEVRAKLPEQVELVCEPEEYRSEWQLRVQWVNKPGGGRFAFKDPLTGQGLKAFAAQMRSTVQSVGRGEVKRPPSTPRSGPPSRNDHPNAPGGPRDRDDIPF